MANKRVDRLAVLIDGENISVKYVGPLFLNVARFGTATVKRIYGDWTLPDHGVWKHALSSHAIMPVQQFRSTSGKNSADCALIIDAMDLLYTGKFEGFCIVSSDGDFTRLACRIRESGLMVYGFGEAKTPAPFVQACDRFIKLEILDATESPIAKSMKSRLNDVEAKTYPVKKSKPLADPKSSQTRIAAPAASETCSPISSIKSDNDCIKMIKSAYNSVSAKDGWAPLAAFGTELLKLSPSFDCRTYGTKKLGELIQATGMFKIKKEQSPKQPKAIIWSIKAK